MSLRRPSLSVLLIVSVIAACGDDGGTSSAGTGTDSASGGSSAGSGTTATGGSGGGSGGGGSGSSGGSSGGGSGSSSGGVVEVELFGDVRDYVLDTVIPDAAIQSYLDATLTTTSAMDGTYSFGPFTSGTEDALVLAPDMTFWGGVVPVTVGTDPMQEVELAMISKEFVQQQYDLLATNQMPAVHDPATAFIVARVRNTAAITEGPVTIDLQPAPAADTFYAPQAGDGAPILGSNQAAFNLIPVVIYYNIPPGDPGAYTMMATHSVRTCTVTHPEFPTLGGHITLVDVSCPPAP